MGSSISCTVVKMSTIVSVVKVEMLKACVNSGTVGTMTLKFSVM